MPKLHYFLSLLLLVSSIALGDDEPPLPELPNLDTIGAGTAMPAADRFAIERAIHEQLVLLHDTLEPLAPEQVAPILLDKLGKIRGVRFAKETDSHDVILQLSDGTPISISTSSGTGLKSVAGASSGPFALPAKSDVALFDIQAMGATVVKLLDKQLSDENYLTHKSGGTLVELRKDIHDRDIVWISTHGGVLDMPLTIDPKGPTLRMFTLSTDDGALLCATAPCPELESDIREMRVLRRVDAKGAAWGYSITRGFVRKYMSFHPHSLVVLDACGSMKDDPAVHDFHRDLIAKGAGTIVGWSLSVHVTFAETTIPYLFDSLLGTGKLHKLKPKQRPFSLPEIFTAMGEAHLLVDPEVGSKEGAAELKYIQSGPEGALLKPSIVFLQVEESQHRLRIFGEFGAEPTNKADATIKFDGQDIGWKFWTHDEIWADLPGSDTANGGDVALIIRGHESNIVPLTYWAGRIKLKGVNSVGIGLPGAVATLNCENLKFRADIHLFRAKPDGILLSGTRGGGRIDIADAMPDLVCDFNEDGYGDQYGALRTVRGPAHYQIKWMRNDDLHENKPWVSFIGHFDRDQKSFAMVLNYLGYAPSKTILLSTGQVVDSSPWFPDAAPRVDTLQKYPQMLNGKFGLPARSGIKAKVPNVGEAEIEYEIPAFEVPVDDDTAA